VRGPRVEIKRMTASGVRELCDQRAGQAGVHPFSPNDLAKSAQRARKSSADQAAETNEASILFGENDETGSSESERIHFPYRVNGHT